MRAPAAALGALLIAMGGAACGPATGSSTAPETTRGQVSLEGSEAELIRPSELSVSVPSCGGDPEVASLDERERSVHIEVVTTQVVRGAADACLDVVQVALEASLGDRDLVDAVSGTNLDVAPAGSGQVECFDADYPLEPTFDSPQDALAHALEVDAAGAPVPASVDDYERVQRSDGWVEFEYRESEDLYLVWGIVQDEDAGWGMTSLGGCFPVSP